MIYLQQLLSSKSKSFVLLAFLCLCLIPVVESADIPAIGQKRQVFTKVGRNANLANHAPVVVSSYHLGRNQNVNSLASGEALTDGIYGPASSWVSNPNDPKPAWALIDLGKIYTIKEIYLFRTALIPLNWSMIKPFQILIGESPDKLSIAFDAQFSKQSTFAVNHTLRLVEQAVTVNSIKGRYVKIQMKQKGAAVFDEIEIYDRSDGRLFFGNTHLRLRDKIKKPALFKLAVNGIEVMSAWQENSANKVFPDEVVELGEIEPLIEVDAARGESESFQIVLRAHDYEFISQLKWVIEPFTGEDKKEVTELKLQVNPIGYSYYRRPFKTFTHHLNVCGWGPEFAVLGEGYYPEILLPNLDSEIPLVPFPVTEMSQTINQPFWCTVKVPHAIKAGIYQSKITISQEMGGKTFQKMIIPIKLRVRKFALPNKRRLDAFANALGHKTMYNHLPRSPIKLDKKTYQNLYRHCGDKGLGFAQFWPKPIIKWVNNEPVINWLIFDEMAEWCIKEQKMPVIVIPGSLFASHQIFYGRDDFLGAKVKPLTDEWFAKFAKITQAWEKHLAEKGWLDRFVLYICNEVYQYDKKLPDPYPAALKILRTAKQAAPRLRCVWHGGPYRPEACQEADIFVMDPRHTSMPYLKERQQKKQTTWAYANYTNLISSPPLACRATGWLLYKYGISGFSFNNITPWRGGRRPMEHIYSGAEMFVYPPEKYGDEFIGSLRLAMYRDGFDDYEYLVMLEDLLKKNAQDPKKAEIVKQGNALLQQAKAFAGNYGYDEAYPSNNADEIMAFGQKMITSGKTRFDYREDPEQLLKMRKQIADTIEQLMD